MIDAGPGRPWLPRAGLLLLGGCSLFACGCGLSDYEKHIDEQRISLAAYDEENKVLGPPLDTPQKTVKQGKSTIPQDALQVSFFLRPPRWISPTIKGQPSFQSQNVALFKYPSHPNYSLLLTTAFLDKSPPPVNQPIKGGIVPKDFRAHVRAALMEYVQRQYREAVDWKAEDIELKSGDGWKHEKLALRVPRDKTVSFDTKVFKAPPASKDPKQQHAFKVCFHIQDQNQAAVIYEVPSADLQTVDKTLEISLKTLVLGINAASKRNEYFLRNQPKVTTR